MCTQYGFCGQVGSHECKENCFLKSGRIALGLVGSEIFSGSPLVVLEMSVLFIKSLVVSESTPGIVELKFAL
jgi:hypothetical protein